MDKNRVQDVFEQLKWGYLRNKSASPSPYSIYTWGQPSSGKSSFGEKKD